MSFGITSDIWSFSDTSLGISLQGVESTPKSATEAQALDSVGDVVAETLHDTTYGQAVSATYKCPLSASTIDFYDTTTSKDFRLGKVIGGYVITNISASTSNGTDPVEITIAGQKTVSADTTIAKYDPGFTLVGGPGAQKCGFTVDASSRLNSTSITASVDVGRSMDSNGEELSTHVTKGRLEGSHTVVGVTGAPEGTADTGFLLLNGPSNTESNTGYESGTATVFKNLTRM